MRFSRDFSSKGKTLCLNGSPKGIVSEAFGWRTKTGCVFVSCVIFEPGTGQRQRRHGYFSSIRVKNPSLLGVGSRIPTVSENSTHLHGTYITNAPVAIFSTDPGNHRGNMEGIRVSTTIILAPLGGHRRRGCSFIHANTRFGLNPSRYSFISRSASRMRQVLQKPVLRCQIPNHALSDTAALFVIALLFCAILAYGVLEAG
uniref:Uncharacterized protein n=1 Tax=Candidatus Kentrum sp. LFY TaxID=2126342 RepID=A0A450UWI1_9GAMM|nr:MAG: hypothetical protein BECKLFY1418A_GA0070994_106412 [Candidatus Kentron sp. LFY]